MNPEQLWTPIEEARKIYLELSPVSYLQRTHDAKIYDVAFDGETLMLASASWVATDPVDPGPGQFFRVVLSRYRATFSNVENLEITVLDPEESPPQPTLADFMQAEIREVFITLPSVTIGTDVHELRFRCKAIDVERSPPALES